jgi:hypothetical protein
VTERQLWMKGRDRTGRSLGQSARVWRTLVRLAASSVSEGLHQGIRSNETHACRQIHFNITREMGVQAQKFVRNDGGS